MKHDFGVDSSTQALGTPRAAVPRVENRALLRGELPHQAQAAKGPGSI